jgi:hypothetical protein
MSQTTMPVLAGGWVRTGRPHRFRRFVDSVLSSYSAVVTDDAGPIPNGSFARAARTSEQPRN